MQFVLDNTSLKLSPRTQSYDATRQYPITLETATALKEIIFGKGTGLFNYEWRIQSFTFSDVDNLQYGIVQKKVLGYYLLHSVAFSHS